MLFRRIPTFAAVLVLLSAPPSWAEQPRLVVVVSVDQLRGDLPLQYRDRFGEDGFRRFFDGGAVYTHAHFQHATTLTGSGHASLATGANPREHGIIGNSWMDPRSGRIVYCVQDPDHKLLGAPTTPASGTSPANLLAPTIGDALIAATGGRSRVFSVAGKDRAAILMGGRDGKAFWLDGAAGRVVTSDYYFDAYPAWVDAFNAAGPMDRYAGRVWDLYQPADEYVNPDVREVEVPNELIGVTFPHSLEGLETTRLYAAISYTPFLDELTIEFARAAIENEALGMRGETDLILIGLSATDLIGHAFGPESREQEDNLLRLDSLLAGFFRFLDERFGEDSVLIALSADHGVDGNPGGKPPARLDPADVVDTARQALEARLGPGDYLLPMREAYLTFTPDLRDERPGDIRALQDAVAQALLRLDGVAFAVPAYKILEGSLDAGNPVMDRIARSYRPGLSGDIFVVPDAYRRVYSGAPRYSATHGTPYSYDTHVAMMFHGPGIPALTADRPAAPESIAPTIAALIGIDPPTAANAPVLAEIAPRPAQTIH